MAKLVSHFRDLSSEGALAGCAFLIDRYRDDLPWSSSDTETWVGVVEGDGTARLIRGERAWYTDVWCSPTGCVYLTVGDDVLIGTKQSDGTYAWNSRALGFRAWGVWGFSDELFYVWGFDGRQQVVARIADTAVRLIPVSGPVVSMSGVSEDVLYLGGEHGLLARYDGHGFAQIPVHERASFNRVVVLSDQLIYASTRAGAVWEGSVHGMSALPVGPGDMLGVASCAGALYCANEWGGLYQLASHQWQPIATPARIRKVWGGESLVMLGNNDLLETRNLTDFIRVERATLEAVYGTVNFDRTPSPWLR